MIKIALTGGCNLAGRRKKRSALQPGSASPEDKQVVSADAPNNKQTATQSHLLVIDAPAGYWFSDPQSAGVLKPAKPTPGGKDSLILAFLA